MKELPLLYPRIWHLLLLRSGKPNPLLPRVVADAVDGDNRRPRRRRVTNNANDPVGHNKPRQVNLLVQRKGQQYRRRLLPLRQQSCCLRYQQRHDKNNY